MTVTFDTETTGLPPKNANWDTDYNQFPYIVQLAWKRSDESEVKDYLIKPEGYEIPKEAEAIHNISTEKALAEGDYFENVIRKFISDCKEANKVIGHNIYFDTSMLKANVLRYIEISGEEGPFDCFWKKQIIQALDKDKRVDTMMKTVKFCNISFPNKKGIKWPTLEELHRKLFNEDFPAHNAKYDVLATEKCFNRLVELNVI